MRDAYFSSDQLSSTNISQKAELIQSFQILRFEYGNGFPLIINHDDTIVCSLVDNSQRISDSIRSSDGDRRIIVNISRFDESNDSFERFQIHILR